MRAYATLNMSLGVGPPLPSFDGSTPQPHAARSRDTVSVIDIGWIGPALPSPSVNQHGPDGGLCVF